MKVLQPLDISVNPASAPLITNSSTKVSNLNVDLLDGLDSTAFEPFLGNPGVNGYVLSSTAAGVRSWVAVGSAPTTYGAVGTYVIALVSNGSVALGGTIAGSELCVSGFNNALNTNLVSQSAMAGSVNSASTLGLSGTWRLLTTANGNASYVLGLFVRVS